MTFVATLISNPAAPALDAAAIERARSALPSAQAPIWLDPGIAADIPFTGPRENPQADDSRALAARVRAALAGVPVDVLLQPASGAAQAAVSRRHGFHHDRPGMHRRTRRLCRAQAAGRGHHRARHARRDRIRAGAARARGAAQGPARLGGRRGDRRAHPAHAGRPHAGRDDAREWRLYLPRLRRLHAVHRSASPP